MAKFIRCTILQISKDHNSQADAFTKLASTTDMKLPRTVTVFRLPEFSVMVEPTANVIIPEYGPDPETRMTPIMSIRMPSFRSLGDSWEGPYIIDFASMKGAYKLKTEEGVPLKNPWNADHLKKYYQ
ncbi:hypothetical protein EZV62_002673 [Acer yangbiense]|uniref:Uncharacterized protein n=1 Tax=Acer yangbiense TaxID=1000413 RepID=A0A5C7IYY1_9ROSI|nr:hypothetical protein EZV62_002673 [Acer yangbiense]